MAVTIKMTNTFRFSNPQVLASPHNYVLDIAQAGYPVPSPSNQINPHDVSSSERLGGPALMKIRPDESFVLDDSQFETMVKSGLQGGMSDFLNNLIFLVSNNTLEVSHNGTPLTTQQILDFGNP